MDITQLRYFITVVDSDFNLSVAAQKLHISQPALSRFILNYEDVEEIELFNRQHGRLKSLTPTGELLYVKGVDLVRQHDQMMSSIRELSSFYGGTIRIGIPPLILSLLFSDVMLQLLTKNPNIKFVMIEQGAFELKNQLLLGQIDFGILLAPNGLNASIFNEMHLHHDQLMAYVHKDHPLAQKETLVWRDFQHQKIIMFDETFMIHHLLNSKFSAYNCYPTQVVHSSSWDFFIEAVKTNNFITILPRPVSDFIGGNTILELPIEDTIDWDVVLTYPKKNHYSVLETYLINSLKDYFTAGLDITPIDKYLVTV